MFTNGSHNLRENLNPSHKVWKRACSAFAIFAMIESLPKLMLQRTCGGAQLLRDVLRVFHQRGAREIVIRDAGHRTQQLGREPKRRMPT